MEKVKASQIIGEEIRTIIPVYYQDTFIGNIEIKNPTQEYANHIKECLKDNLLDDDLLLDMLKTLTDIIIDVEISAETFKYYSEVFENVMIELNSIVFEIASNQALEAYSINKMPENKKQMMEEILSDSATIIDTAKKMMEDGKKSKELKQAEEELKAMQDKIASLRGE